MADTRRSTGSEQYRDAESQERVEVFDVATGGIREHETTTSSDQHSDNGMSPHGDTGLGNADLRNARVVTSDAEPTRFRTTDLRETELNTTTAANRTDSGAAGQGTNWGTILMVIAIILVVILLGSWLF
ncbi:MAG: hypothetical protein DYG89_26945 [Caldilinea sp. CFX5]|nr:hypothetical protein [Caldilinea sp. CFX5]